MPLKPLEVGDSVKVKYTTKIHNNDATIYLDGKLVHKYAEEFNTNDGFLWLVEYDLDRVIGAPKYKSCWWESDITSKHHVPLTDDNYFDKAEKISIDDYDGVLFYDDYFFDSVDELLDHWGNIAGEDDEPPKYVWACDTGPVKLRLNLEDSVSEMLEEDGYEGLSERSQFQPLYDELKAIQDKLVALAAQETVSYPNYKKAVIL